MLAKCFRSGANGPRRTRQYPHLTGGLGRVHRTSNSRNPLIFAISSELGACRQSGRPRREIFVTGDDQARPGRRIPQLERADHGELPVGRCGVRLYGDGTGIVDNVDGRVTMTATADAPCAGSENSGKDPKKARQVGRKVSTVVGWGKIRTRLEKIPRQAPRQGGASSSSPSVSCAVPTTPVSLSAPFVRRERHTDSVCLGRCAPTILVGSLRQSRAYSRGTRFRNRQLVIHKKRCAARHLASLPASIYCWAGPEQACSELGATWEHHRSTRCGTCMR